MHLLATSAGLAWSTHDEIALLDLPHPSATALLADPSGLARLSTAQVRERRSSDDPAIEVRRPFESTTAIYLVGLNYHSKSALTGRPAPTEPGIYLKAPSSLGTAGAEIVFPAALTEEPDYEAEIGVVIGRGGYRISESAAWHHVAGVVALNDSTARDVMRKSDNVLFAKSIPGATPTGPTVFMGGAGLADTVLTVRSWVNGELRQDSDSTDLIFPIDALVSYLSHFVELRPGDIIATGTPAGTGQDLDRFLADGDEVEIQIGSLAPLVNRIRISHAAIPGKD